MKLQRVGILLGLVAASSSSSFSQDRFPDSPANHAAYECLHRIVHAGLLEYPPSLNRSGPPPTRLEISMLVSRVVREARARWESMDVAAYFKDLNSKDAQAYLSNLSKLRLFVWCQFCVTKLFDIFEEELKKDADFEETRAWIQKAPFLFSTAPYVLDSDARGQKLVKNELPKFRDDSEHHYIFEGLSEMKKVGVKIRQRGLMNYPWSRPEVAVAAYDVFTESQRRWIILKSLANQKATSSAKVDEADFDRQILWARVFEGWSHGFRATMREFSSELRQMGLDSEQTAVWIMKTAEEMRALPFGIGKRS